MKKQADGRYRTKITVGHYADGEPIVKYASGRTQEELKKNRAELKRRYINGAIEVDRGKLLNVCALEWFDQTKASLGASSRQGYASVLNKHIFPAFDKRQLRAVTRKDLQDFMDSKAGLKSSSLGNILHVLRQTFQQAYADGLIDRDPTVGIKKPSAKKDSRRALTELETEAVLKVADEDPEGLLLLVLYFTGVRIGEALGLQWRDVDFENKVIRVERDIDFHDNATVGTVKTAAAVRAIPMPARLHDALSAARGIGDAFIFQAPLTHKSLCESTYKRRWKRLMRAMAVEAEKIIEEQREEKAAGKEIKISPMIETKVMNPKAKPERHVPMSILTPHYFRHNYASILYDADVDILSAQRFLGHSDIKTTLQIYSHLSKQKEAQKAISVREAFDVIYKVAKKLPGEVKTELLKE